VFQLSKHLQLHYTDIGMIVPIPICEHRRIHELTDRLKQEGVNIKYRERIKRKYRIRKWSDRADKWLAKQKEPVKVSFD